MSWLLYSWAHSLGVPLAMAISSTCGCKLLNLWDIMNMPELCACSASQLQVNRSRRILCFRLNCFQLQQCIQFCSAVRPPLTSSQYYSQLDKRKIQKGLIDDHVPHHLILVWSIWSPLPPPLTYACEWPSHRLIVSEMCVQGSEILCRYLFHTQYL